MTRAIFPGSFDPLTKGHEDIIQRALSVFDEVVVAIGENSEKHTLFSAEERKKQIEEVFADEKRVRVIIYSGLTADLVKEHDATCLLKGARNTIDFEYERQQADANRELANVETIIMLTRPEFSHISSTLVRDLQHHGRDVKHLTSVRI